MRTVNPRFSPWLYIGVCALILLKTEGSNVNLTYLHSAVAKGAVCLDGSPPAFQFDEGFGEGANSWLIHIDGGAWCESVKECEKRMNTSVGSSKKMSVIEFTGILSNNQSFNPNFYNWNRIFLRYCDGASFTGDVEAVDPTTNLHFRGARIFDAVIDHLLTIGMKNAQNVLLSGSSAGGLASMLHCDKFKALLPTNISRVKCILDASYFIHSRSISGRYFLEEQFDKVAALHGSAKNLPSSCTSNMKPGLCFYPQYVVPQVRTPLFIINSAYDIWQISVILAPKVADPLATWAQCKYDIEKCTPSQVKIWKDFRSQFLSALSTGVGNSSSTGMFINSCFTHCQSVIQEKWLGDIDSKLDNKAIGEVVGDWYYDRKVVQLVDLEHDLPRKCVLNLREPNSKNNYTWG